MGFPVVSSVPLPLTHTMKLMTKTFSFVQEVDDNETEESCKHPESDFVAFQVEATRCWATSPSTPAYLMSHFCMPRLSGQIADLDHQAEIDEKITNCVRADNDAN